MLTLERPTVRVEWNPRNWKQVEEAKSVYRKARAAGHVIVHAETGRPVDGFTPALEGLLILPSALAPGACAMRIFDETGDRRVVWNATDPKQVAEAARLFQDYVRRGWKAYAVSQEGKKGRRIAEFRADTEEVLFDETTTPMKLKAFVEKFTAVNLLPRTYPG